MAEPGTALGLPPGPTYDYGAPPGAPGDRTVRVLVVLGALVVGFVLASGLAAARGDARAQEQRRAALVALIDQRQLRVDQLAARLEDLRARVAAAEAEAAAGLPALSARVAEAEALAGLTPVAGPGVVVTLADAGQRCGSDVPEDCRILDTDLQAAVNTLFAAGAEAVAVNGERVIATTAIRRAGTTVLVNYRPLTSPYTVAAVGDPEALTPGLAASGFGQDFTVWSEVFGLGYRVEPRDELVLDAYAGGVRLRSATVAPAAPAPSASPRPAPPEEHP